MTTPSSNIGLAAVQTEFGGANPISLSEYYRGGSLVPSGTAAGTSGSQIATSGAIRLGDFRAVAGFSIATATIGVFNTGSANAIRNGFFQLNSDGTSTKTPGGAATSWGSPTTTGIGSSYWVKATRVNQDLGTFYSGTYDTWVQLTSGSQWGFHNTSSGAEAFGTLKLEIAASSGGAVLGTLTVNFDCGTAT
jgi:hypothetical protein